MLMYVSDSRLAYLVRLPSRRGDGGAGTEKDKKSTDTYFYPLGGGGDEGKLADGRSRTLGGGGDEGKLADGRRGGRRGSGG